MVVPRACARLMSSPGNTNTNDVTVLLERIRTGDADATAQLLDLAYGELRGMAGRLFQQQPSDHTLQPTALVNELCAKLLRGQPEGWTDRQHFFRAAGKAMRHLLTDHARARKAARRGGGQGVRVDVGLDQTPAAAPVDLVGLDEALTKLAGQDERLGQTFELRFLVGLSVDRTAEMLGVSARTVELDTRFIRAWLQKELAA